MAASSFRSSARRFNSGGAGSRRSRSVAPPSRFPPPTPEHGDETTPRSRFVNKLRGTGGTALFPESLEDLADEFFKARAESDEEGDGCVRRSAARYARETESSRIRGRSMSRPPGERRLSVASTRGNWSGSGSSSSGSSWSGGRSRQRHSSVDPQRRYESENEMAKQSFKHSGAGTNHGTTARNPSRASNSLRRSTSQKDFLRSQDNCSSHSSLTDDEIQDYGSSRKGKRMWPVHTREEEHHIIGDGNELYEAMRKEVRDAVQGMKAELEKVIAKAGPGEEASNADVQPIQIIAELRRNYTSKLEESEKRRQKLLAELAAEEQRGHELTKIVKELLPSPQKTPTERQSRSRRRGGNDKSKISQCLFEEAERYFEDFLSNVEDTDFSSFDGEISDTSLTRRDVAAPTSRPDAQLDLAKVSCTTEPEADGVLLPWLQWETSNDVKHSPCKVKTEVLVSEGGSASCSKTNRTSSRGSWSPQDSSDSATSGTKVGSKLDFGANKGSTFSMEEYMHLRSSDDLVFEQWRQRERIHSGGLLLCCRPTVL